MSSVEKQITIQDFCKKGLASPRSQEHEHYWYKVAVGHWKVVFQLFSLILAITGRWKCDQTLITHFPVFLSLMMVNEEFASDFQACVHLCWPGGSVGHLAKE